MNTVTMYTKPGCPYCAKAKDHYNGKGITFDEINVVDNAEAQKKEPPPPASPPGTAVYYVTLQQAASLVSLGKRTLEKYLVQGKIPPPCRPGYKGKAHKWQYHIIRPKLEEILGQPLPERFPADRFIRR